MVLLGVLQLDAEARRRTAAERLRKVKMAEHCAVVVPRGVRSRRLMRVGHAALYLGVGRGTMLKLCRSGDLHPVLLRRRKFFDVEELDRFVAGLPSWNAGGPAGRCAGKEA